MTVTVKEKRKKVLKEGDRDHALGDAKTTIFSSRDTMTSEERTAVKIGENRGKRVVESENTEKYGNLASINHRRYEKNLALAYGNCKRCGFFVRGTDKPGEHCSLDCEVNCVG